LATSEPVSAIWQPVRQPGHPVCSLQLCSGTEEALFARCSIWTVLAKKIPEQQFHGSDGPIGVSQ
jgi:hypothetical protein